MEPLGLSDPRLLFLASPQPEVSHAQCQGWNVLRSVLLIVWVILRDGASEISMLL